MAESNAPKGLHSQHAGGQPAIAGADSASNGSAAGPSRSNMEQALQLSDTQEQPQDNLHYTQPPSAGE